MPMKFLAILLIALAIGCGRPQTAQSLSSEKTYTMNGKLMSRNVAKNEVAIDNEDVPGVMSPMVMDYELRGAKVNSLPPDGTKITSKLHEQDGKYWVTDVKPIAVP